MDEGSGSSIILIFILVMVNAFFASAEMAIVSINKTKLNLLAEDGNKKAKEIMNEVFIKSLEIMVKGMGGIFVVMLIIFIAIKLLAYFGKPKLNNKD